MTLRRWEKGLDPQEEELAIGPQERQVRRELLSLGWDDATPGALATSAESALAVAESIDRSVSARDIAASTRELSRIMTEARAHTKGRKLSVVQQAQQRGQGREGGPRRAV